MTKVFFRYFLSILAIAFLIILIQVGVLLVQYDVSQGRWKNRVYDDFVTSVESAITDGDFADYGINSILRAVSEIEDDRVSGFILRDSNGSIAVTFGKTSDGRMLSTLMSNNSLFPSEDSAYTSVKRATRLNISTDLSTGKINVGSSSAGNIRQSLPSALKNQGIIGSIIIALSGRDAFTIDLLTFSPRTYEYSKDIINSCLKGLLSSLPVCLLIALAASWVISSRYTKYINDVRKALNDLSHGKPNVSIPKQSNSELNEITVAIQDLDRSLQSNIKSRKAWLQSISHDLNTPAAALKMIIDGMNDGVFPADEDTLKSLGKEIDSLSERIGKVIEFSTLQADAVPFTEEFSSKQFIEDVLSSFRNSDSVIALSECENLRCDRTLMSHAVTELLKNAVEAGGKTPIPVRWTIRETDGFYEMEISNPGKLSSDMESDFFEPWSRGDWSRTGGGSGLGLPIAYTILYLHKGTVSLIQSANDTVTASVRWPKNY